MSEHTCTSLNPGCYRCDLNRDEIRAYVESLVVTKAGVVHDPDCSFVGSLTSTAIAWDPQFSTDRACSRCLPDGLPDLAVIA